MDVDYLMLLNLFGEFRMLCEIGKKKIVRRFLFRLEALVTGFFISRQPLPGVIFTVLFHSRCPTDPNNTEIIFVFLVLLHFLLVISSLRSSLFNTFIS